MDREPFRKNPYTVSYGCVLEVKKKTKEYSTIKKLLLRCVKYLMLTMDNAGQMIISKELDLQN